MIAMWAAYIRLTLGWARNHNIQLRSDKIGSMLQSSVCLTTSTLIKHVGNCFLELRKTETNFIDVISSRGTDLIVCKTRPKKAICSISLVRESRLCRASTGASFWMLRSRLQVLQACDDSAKQLTVEAFHLKTFSTRRHVCLEQPAWQYYILYSLSVIYSIP